MNILGIETSCDETAASVVNEEGKILSSLVLSQLKEHEAFGGVVPELAARAHIEHIHTLIKAAMSDANLKFCELDGIAATSGPGLIGGVMVGMMAECPGRFAAQQIRVKRAVAEPKPEALLEGRANVAHGFELAPDP